MTALEQLENYDNLITIIKELSSRVEALEQGNVSARTLAEIAPDAGYLGSGSISNLIASGQMASTLFKSGTQTVFQNTLRITKGGGLLPTDIFADDTIVDFGHDSW